MLIFIEPAQFNRICDVQQHNHAVKMRIDIRQQCLLILSQRNFFLCKVCRLVRRAREDKKRRIAICFKGLHNFRREIIRLDFFGNFQAAVLIHRPQRFIHVCLVNGAGTAAAIAELR